MPEQESLKKAERLSKLSLLLYRYPHGLTAREMAHLCGVTQRTIQRDLQSLQRTGVPLWQDDSRYGVLEGYFLPPLKLKLHEAASLYLAARLLARYSDQRQSSILSALAKLAGVLPDVISTHVQRSIDTLAYKKANPAFDAVFETVALAWASGRKVRIWHQAAHSAHVHEYLVSPYVIEPSGEGYSTYLIGHASYFGALHTFKMERIVRAELSAEIFEPPADFNGPRLLASAWGVMYGDTPTPVRLRFSPQVTRRVKESVWHPSQVLEDCDDGGCILSVRVAMPLEMKPWIRGWGCDVEVLEPEELRTEIAGEARRTAEVYA